MKLFRANQKRFLGFRAMRKTTLDSKSRRSPIIYKGVQHSITAAAIMSTENCFFSCCGSGQGRICAQGFVVGAAAPEHDLI